MKNPPDIAVDSFWLPKQSSTFAAQVDYGWDVVYWVSIVLFVGVTAAMTYFVWKYRQKKAGEIGSTYDHNTFVEVVWSVGPLVILAWLFIIGFKGYVNASVAPAEAYEIKVTAKKWNWTFTYPDGTVSPGELVIPAGKPVKMIMSSQDVLHSFYIPEFRVKQDVLPGNYTTLWFEALAPGKTKLLCTEYCGTSHSEMLADVKILSEKDFQEWIDTGGGLKDVPPAEMGKLMYTRNGCNACHSVDGTKLVGPSFKGLFGREETLADGSKVTVDENYIRESILNPAGQIVQGFPPSMPTFKGVLKDNQIDGIIEYIKTLK